MSTNYAVEFLIWVLIAASAIAVLALRLRIPYTVALVLGGLGLGSIHLPILDALIGQRPGWMTPDVALILFLPALLFGGSLKLQARQLHQNLVPILLLANVGVLVAAFITGLAVHWAEDLPLLTALVFGAVVSATDPISVLAIFRETSISKSLSVIVEGESLLNDGIAAVFIRNPAGGNHYGNCRRESGNPGISGGCPGRRRSLQYPQDTKSQRARLPT